MPDITEPSKYLALKASMMPRDTNKYGTIFGGVLLSYIDLAADVGARKAIHEKNWPEHQLVTIAMDKIEFKQPVFVGDTVSFFTRVIRIGTTSICLHISVEAERAGEIIQVTEAEVTYVSVKTVGSSRVPVPLRGE